MASSSSNLKLQLKKTSNKEINEILTKNPIKAFVLSFPEQRLYFKVRKESFVNFELNKEKDTLMMKKVNKKRKGYYGDQLINLKDDPIDLKVESYVDKFFEDKKKKSNSGYEAKRQSEVMAKYMYKNRYF